MFILVLMLLKNACPRLSDLIKDGCSGDIISESESGAVNHDVFTAPNNSSKQKHVKNEHLNTHHEIRASYNGRNWIYLSVLEFSSSANMDRMGFMSCTAASHQGLTKLFVLH